MRKMGRSSLVIMLEVNLKATLPQMEQIANKVIFLK